MIIIERARSWIGVITAYSMDSAAQGPHCTDCSGFLWRVLGKPKNQGGLWWNTDRIYGDATGAQVQFERIDAPEVGCIAVYGRRQNRGNAGHVAIVIDPAARTIIDCSSSQNGVHVHDGGYWWRHAGAVWCRYKGTIPETVP